MSENILFLEADGIDVTEMAMIEQDIAIESFANIVTRTTNAYERIKSDPENTEIHIASIADILEAFSMDEEKLGDFAFTKKVLSSILKLLSIILDKFLDFMGKYFSMLNYREGQAAKLVAGLNGKLHHFKEDRPTIKATDEMAAIIDKGKLISPVEYSAMASGVLAKVDPSSIQNVIEAEVAAMASNIAMSDNVHQVAIDTEKRIWEVVTTQYKASQVNKNGREYAYISVDGIPLSIELRRNPSGVPSVKLIKTQEKLPKTIDGVNAQEALVLVSQAQQVFSQALDQDSSKDFKRRIKKLKKDIGAKDLDEVQAKYMKMVPMWASFMRSFTKASLNYEYRTGLSALAVVQSSYKKWERV